MGLLQLQIKLVSTGRGLVECSPRLEASKDFSFVTNFPVETNLPSANRLQSASDLPPSEDYLLENDELLATGHLGHNLGFFMWQCSLRGYPLSKSLTVLRCRRIA